MKKIFPLLAAAITAASLFITACVPGTVSAAKPDGNKYEVGQSVVCGETKPGEFHFTGQDEPNGTYKFGYTLTQADVDALNALANGKDLKVGQNTVCAANLSADYTGKKSESEVPEVLDSVITGTDTSTGQESVDLNNVFTNPAELNCPGNSCNSNGVPGGHLPPGQNSANTNTGNITGQESVDLNNVFTNSAELNCPGNSCNSNGVPGGHLPPGQDPEKDKGKP